ncbi:hypothetical protein BU17DRAFT_72440 [Hysterangium stoloniferum]|nr:hypothetical protein BU17DRAFT_72440 [Hysterangium stoloniferum]
MAKGATSMPSVPSLSCPKRGLHPASKVVDPANIASAELRSHKDAINARRMAEAAEAASGQDTTRSTLETSGWTSPPILPITVTSSLELPTTGKHSNLTIEGGDDSDNDQDLIRHRSKKSRHLIIINESDEERQGVSENSPEQGKTFSFR